MKDKINARLPKVILIIMKDVFYYTEFLEFTRTIYLRGYAFQKYTPWYICFFLHLVNRSDLLSFESINNTIVYYHLYGSSFCEKPNRVDQSPRRKLIFDF